jgi:hypothetical protein
MMDQPSAAELVTAVREFIEKHAIPQLSGRTAFHGRVAANALAIVARELEQGPAALAAETESLRALLGEDRIDPMDPALARHLVASTLAKVAIDQPTYAGFVHSPHRTR